MTKWGLIDNKLKLGVFAANISGGCIATTVDRYNLTWANTVDVATVADRAGFEIQLPLARWRPLGGRTNFQGTSFESLTWAAGLAGVTTSSGIFSTVHVPTIHPIVAAKQMTTVDHISGGRFGLNIVCGWNPSEFAMFGSPMMEHGDRYAYAAEWIEVVRKLWTCEEEFDFNGRFINVVKGWHEPKPLQKPLPPIMNAGLSATGARFAARYADIGFLALGDGDVEAARPKFAELRRIARDDFGRSVDVWTGATVICRSTEREAKEYFNHCVFDNGDLGVLDGLPPELVPQPGSAPEEVLNTLRHRALAGFGGKILLGSPDQIVSELTHLSDVGADGVVLTWVNHNEDIRTWVQHVMPRLEQAGLRRPSPSSAAVS